MDDNKNRGVALITGASRGIGAEIARQLAARRVGGLVLVARTESDLNDLAQEIRQHYQTPVTVLAVDLAQEDAAVAIKAETDRRGLSVDLLVNNAGFGSYGVFDETDANRDARLVHVNVAAVVALTHAFLPAMVARGGGGILNVSSTAGFQPVPFMATYGATKAFVLSFSEALWAENRDRGVRVVCLCPGGTATDFDFGAAERGAFEGFLKSTTVEVAKAGLDALDRNASYVVVGRANYASSLAVRLAPRALVARAAAAMFRPNKKSATAALPVMGIAAAAISLMVGAAVWLRRRA